MSLNAIAANTCTVLPSAPFFHYNELKLLKIFTLCITSTAQCNFDEFLSGLIVNSLHGIFVIKVFGVLPEIIIIEYQIVVHTYVVGSTLPHFEFQDLNLGRYILPQLMCCSN